MSARAPATGWLDLVRARWRPATLGLVIGIAALVAATWGVPLDQVGASISGAGPGGLLAMAAVFMGQQALRAWRQLLLLRHLAPHHTFRTSLSVLCISFFFINTLPARIGEAVRPLLLYERDRIPLGAGLAMVVVERVVDLLATFVMLALVAFFVEVPQATVTLGSQEVDFLALGRGLALWAVPAGIIGLGVLVWSGPRLLERVEPWAQRDGTLGRAAGVLLRLGAGFVAGLDGLKEPRLAAQVFVLTVLTWGSSVAMYPLLASSFGLEGIIDLGAGLAILCITMLGMIVPSAPGFAGTFEAFFRAALALFGVSGDGPAPGGEVTMDAIAVAFALTFHWWQYGVQAASALVFLALDGIDLDSLRKGLRDGMGGADPIRSARDPAD